MADEAPSFEEGKEFVVDFAVGWARLEPEPGQVLEVFMPGTSHPSPGRIWAAFLVKEVRFTAMGTKAIIAKFIGSLDVNLNKELSTQFNRRQGILHLCPSRPCIEDIEEISLHVTQVRWWHWGAFDASYITPAIKRQVGKWIDQIAAEELREEGEPTYVEPQAKAAPGPEPLEYTPEVIPRDTSEKVPDLIGLPPGLHPPGEDPEQAKREDLRRKLRDVRDRVAGGGTADASQRVSWASPLLNTGSALLGQGSIDAQDAKMRPLRSGSIFGTTPALGNQEAARDLITHGWKGPGQEILQQAMTVEAMRGRSKRHKKKKKKGAHKLAAALRGVVLGKKKKKKRGGGPGDSSGPSSSDLDPWGVPLPKKRKKTDGTMQNSRSDSSSSSDSTSVDSKTMELDAPIKKMSKDRPGSVLEMLVTHVADQLSQASMVDVNKATHKITQGVKLTTYFSLHVRAQHPGALRELRELFMLSRALDLVRVGDIPSAGDLLAARFMAIHQSLNDGSWSAARHMEIAPLEDSQSTAPGLLLATRKHTRLFQKLQGHDQGYGGGFAYGRGRGRRQWSGWPADGEKAEGSLKGKGKGGKFGKGKGKGQSKGGNSWATNLEKTEEKTTPKS